MKVLRSYCDKILLYTGVNRMWITESTQDILGDIEHLNSKNKATSVSTFDFSTLYTKIDLEDLKDKLRWVVDKAFKGGSNQWIRVQGKEAWFDKGKNKVGNLYSKEDIRCMIDHLVDNAVFKVGDTAFQQVIGIPMGTDPAPFMANLYLFYYEFKWMTELTATNFGIARKYYGHTRRFIDDLATLNNNKHLENNWKNIYPKELVLNKENDQDQAATFLDLDIKLQGNIFITSLYDKREAFNFEIVSYPDIRGNIPENHAYGVCIGQVLRIARNTTKKEEFIARTVVFLQKLENKGYNSCQLQNTIKKCLRQHSVITNKYNTTATAILQELYRHSRH